MKQKETVKQWILKQRLDNYGYEAEEYANKLGLGRTILYGNMGLVRG